MAFDLSKIKNEEDFWQHIEELSDDDIDILCNAGIVNSDPDVDFDDFELPLDCIK
ncbi:MAG: hypothetical protein IKQ30_05435 [Bacteroidales bacterium]|jgi:hypothetical protein|nr:hypothetical protein [Bacteroidales bacterium]MBR4272262.1 hypothetical protein [Bacteroidales bacterium]